MRKEGAWIGTVVAMLAGAGTAGWQILTRPLPTAGWGTVVAILAGPGAAFAASSPAFILGLIIADNWLPTRPPHAGEFVMALFFLAIGASVVTGLPFSGYPEGSSEGSAVPGLRGMLGPSFPLSAPPLAAGGYGG